MIRASGVGDSRAPDWRGATIALVSVFLVTRVLVVFAALLVELVLPLVYQGPTWDSRTILASLTGSDAVYYLGIAEEGYHLEPIKEDHRDWVFFPIYPIAVRFASVFTFGDVALAGVLVANLAFLAAMFALYRLSFDHIGHERAVRSVAYLAIAPGAVSFVMAYSESLFILVSVGACLAAERRRWLLMATLYALASATRLQGVLLGMPLLLLMARQGATKSPIAFSGLLAGPLALGAFFAYLALFTGDTFAYFHAQEAWDIAPLLGADDAVVVSVNPVLPYILLATLLGYVFLLVYMRADRIPFAYIAIAVLAILAVFAGGRLMSVGRYLATAWPFSWVLAGRTSPWFQLAWPIASTGLFIGLAVAHFTQTVAP